MKFSIATLTVIRRKVDKAVKRAQAAQEQAVPVSPQEAMFRGTYSPCFPASVGATTAHMVYPQVQCLDADDAAWMAAMTPSPPTYRPMPDDDLRAVL